MKGRGGGHRGWGAVGEHGVVGCFGKSGRNAGLRDAAKSGQGVQYQYSMLRYGLQNVPGHLTLRRHID